MNFPLPNWCETKELSPSTQLQPSLQLALHQAVCLQSPCAGRHSPKTESWIQYLATLQSHRREPGLQCRELCAVIPAPSPVERDPTVSSIPCNSPVLCPCCSTRFFPVQTLIFFCTTPLFIFQLPIIWTSYYLVNNSTSLTSFLIIFFFFLNNQKLRVTYLSVSYTQDSGAIKCWVFSEYIVLVFHWGSGLFWQGPTQSLIVRILDLQSPSLPARSPCRSQLV